MTFQAQAVLQGRTYEDVVARSLAAYGWHIQTAHWREPCTLVEIDIVAADPNGEIWWIECKGSWQSASGRNGLARTDSTKKLIANAAILSTLPASARRPYMVVSSDAPAGAGAIWLEIAKRHGWVSSLKIVEWL